MDRYNVQNLRDSKIDYNVNALRYIFYIIITYIIVHLIGKVNI